MTPARCVHLGAPGLAIILLVTSLVTRVAALGLDTQDTPDVAVKAALIFNFVKFTEWPAVPVGQPFVVCIVGDDRLAAAFVETVRGKTINGRSLELGRPGDSAAWLACHVLFIAATQTRQSAGGLLGIKTAPVLTVSDRQGFAQAGGIIELYVEGGRMRFAINVDAAERAGLHLSSRLLGLAKVMRDGDDDGE